MSIKIYDTRVGAKVDFVPIEAGRVRMYVCGPTVYDRIHVGNARTFISFDVIRRYFIWRGFDVTFVQNITDVDDKIITRANEEGRTAQEVARCNTEAFIEDMQATGVLDPDLRPRATDEIEEMIDLIGRLIDGGYAYEVDGDVYFSVRSFDGYGQLAHRDVDEMEGGHRELRFDGLGLKDRKRDSGDFALWKAAKPSEPAWPSPWGKGRPGWHIECSAMAHKYLGLPFDIHGGGQDLVFPHHENERAQSEAAYGCVFANYWMHSGMLQIINEETGEEEKMSKSLNNFLLLHDVLENTSAGVLRMLMLQTHYRSPLVFSEARISEAAAALERIKNAKTNLDWALDNAIDATEAGRVANVSPITESDIRALCEAQTHLRSAFEEAMDDDFNTAGALGEIFGFVGDVNAHVVGKQATVAETAALRAARDQLVELMGVFGIDLDEGQACVSYPAEVVDLAADIAGYTGSDPVEAVEILLRARTAARREKRWECADRVRDGLTALGLHIEDTAQGPRIA